MKLHADQRTKVVRAMRQSQYRWRTARGLAKETDLPIEAVVDFLEKSSDVIRAKKSNSKGQALYALREKAIPLGQRVFNALLNRPEE